MKLRHLKIEHFRGINSLEWCPDPGFNLLLGPGDSCKTTVIDAVDYVLGPRWSLAFTDADFFNSDTTRPIVIQATIGDLPKKILGDLRFETSFRGWSSNGLKDEPVEEEDSSDELVLTIQLQVDHSLEPTWQVWTERDVENRPVFRSQDREILGVIRVGAYIDRHLSWGKGSALDRYSESDDRLGPVFAQVRRETQEAFDQQDLKSLRDIATTLESEAQENGVQFVDGLKPGLEITALQSSASVVTLFDGKVPSRQMGLGSRRLLVTTMQLQRDSDKSVLLVDEIETALEPHRVRKLIQTLVKSELQLIVTSHSPIAVQEAYEQSVFLVRRNEDKVSVVPMPSAIKVNLKKSPYAALARRVLVCEGKTEQGFLSACRELWLSKHSLSLDALGIAEAYGEGQPNGGKLALAFANSKFDAAFFFDADRGPGFAPEVAEAAGLTTFPHAVNSNSERAFFNSLSDEQINEVLELIRERVGNLRSILGCFFNLSQNTDVLWDSTVIPIQGGANRLECLIGLASKGNPEKKPTYPECPYFWSPWLKDTETARVALAMVADNWDDFAKTELGKVLEPIRIWCYGE